MRCWPGWRPDGASAARNPTRVATPIGQTLARGAGRHGAPHPSRTCRRFRWSGHSDDPALCDARAPALADTRGTAAPGAHRLAASSPDHQRAGCAGGGAADGAAGAGVIPWQLDLDRSKRIFSSSWPALPPQPRHLSIAGARILAGQLRDAVARRQALAVARVGTSRACPFDLHALLPVPAALLRRGPDDPAALAWLWTRWGTTAALRHVSAVDTAFADDPAPVAGAAVFRVSFWSADGHPGGRWPRSPPSGRRCALPLRPRYATP